MAERPAQHEIGWDDNEDTIPKGPKAHRGPDEPTVIQPRQNGDTATGPNTAIYGTQRGAVVDEPVPLSLPRDGDTQPSVSSAALIGSPERRAPMVSVLDAPPLTKGVVASSPDSPEAMVTAADKERKRANMIALVSLGIAAGTVSIVAGIESGFLRPSSTPEAVTASVNPSTNPNIPISPSVKAPEQSAAEVSIAATTGVSSGEPTVTPSIAATALPSVEPTTKVTTAPATITISKSQPKGSNPHEVIDPWAKNNSNRNPVVAPNATVTASTKPSTAPTVKPATTGFTPFGKVEED